MSLSSLWKQRVWVRRGQREQLSSRDDRVHPRQKPLASLALATNPLPLLNLVRGKTIVVSRIVTTGTGTVVRDLGSTTALAGKESRAQRIGSPGLALDLSIKSYGQQ